MPAPTTADELLELIQKSQLVDEGRLRAYTQKLRDTNTLPADPAKLAALMYRDAILTSFQAEQLLLGKYKRFSLGKYKVLERLGSGGMGTVFLCEHRLMRRRVAVKVLPILKSEDEASLKRFEREARAAAALDHPNIVRAYDIDQDENLHFIVMEWVDGTNLQDLVKKFGPLDALRACHYIYGAAVGLQHAHEIGLLHRDIKPGNILVDRSGVVKILDMGLARLTLDTEDNLTRQNEENILGTADYLAPEQARDSHTVDIRADIYSLGATFYFLLTGSPPFQEGSVAQKLIWLQNRAPRPLKTLRAEVPDDLVALVERMMAKEPDARPQTSAEVMAALAPWVATPIPPPAEREMPTLSPAVAGAGGGRGTATSTALGGMGARPLPAPGATTFTGMPTTIASVPPSMVSTPPPASSPSNTPAVWSTLDTDTQTVARGDTATPGPADEPDEEERPSRASRRAAEQARGWGKGTIILVSAAGIFALVAVAAAAYFLFLYKPAEPTHTQPPPPASKITVSKAGGDNSAPTLRRALDKVPAGGTIVIAEPYLVEPLLKLDPQRHKNITIESVVPGGRPAVIEFQAPKDAKGDVVKGGAMIDAPGVEGLRIRNVELDGKGVAEWGVHASGTAPGLTFEGVSVRGTQKGGFQLVNLAGEQGRPVTLERVRVQLAPGGEAGVKAHAFGVLNNKHIDIKNSRFEGPGHAGIRIDGLVLDFEITNNRFYTLACAVSFINPSGVSKGKFTNNTVYQATYGLWFEVPQYPPPPPPKDPKAPPPDPKAPVPPPLPPPPVQYEWEVKLNYFALTGGGLLQLPAPSQAKLTGEYNVHDASPPGTPPLPGATKLDEPKLPPPNPNDDAKFLRFPDPPPTVGPNKQRFGAQ